MSYSNTKSSNKRHSRNTGLFILVLLITGLLTACGDNTQAGNGTATATLAPTTNITIGGADATATPDITNTPTATASAVATTATVTTVATNVQAIVTTTSAAATTATDDPYPTPALNIPQVGPSEPVPQICWVGRRYPPRVLQPPFTEERAVPDLSTAGLSYFHPALSGAIYAARF